MNHVSDIKKLLGAFSGQANTLVIPRAYIAFTGSIEAALLLSQIVYWSDGRTHDPEGWFYKTYKEWSGELSLSEYQVRKCSKQFQQFGFLETKVAKVKGDPTLHYRLDWDVFLDSLVEFLQEPTRRNSTNLVPEETQGTNPNDLKEPLYLQKLRTEIAPEINFIVPEREEAQQAKQAKQSETESPSILYPLSAIGESSTAAAPPPVEKLHDPTGDRFRKPLPPWRDSQHPNGWNEAILSAYVKRVDAKFKNSQHSRADAVGYFVNCESAQRQGNGLLMEKAIALCQELQEGIAKQQQAEQQRLEQ